jgi:anaerobic magnesium-protoporphyrin IX monomethyl ester cyclase
MLLEPYSTITTVRNNIAFLDRFVGDGWTVAGFCRTLPYTGTPLKHQLEAEGRLLGTAFEPDYNFLDPRLDLFYDWMLLTFPRAKLR